MTARFIAGWRQVGACLVLQVVGAAMLVPAFSVMAVSLGQEFHPSRMVLMLAITLMALISAILSPFIGSLMDRTSLRRLMGLGIGFIVAGYLALSFATSFIQVLLIYALLMAPASVLVGPIAASVLISRWFIARRGAALGIAMSGVALGAFVFPPLVQWLIDSFAWRSGLRLLALVIFVLAFPASTLIVNQPADSGLNPDGVQADPGISPDNEPAPVLTTRAILTDATFWFAAAVFAVVLSGMTGLITNLVPLATDQGIRPDRAAMLLSINAAFAFCAKLIFAAVSDSLSLRTLMIVSLAGFGVGMACLVRADAGFWLIAIGVGFVGLFGSFMSPLQPLLVSRAYGPWAMGRVAGLMNLVVLCALLASPPIFGLMFDLAGDYDAIFLVYAVLGVATGLVVPRIRLQQRASDFAGTKEAGNPGAETSPLENTLVSGRA